MVSKNSRSPYMHRIAAWVLFAWGVFALVVMWHYASAYKANPRANEMGVGFMIAFVYSALAWVGLPVYVISAWKQSPLWERSLMLAPPVLAVVALFYMSYASN